MSDNENLENANVEAPSLGKLLKDAREKAGYSIAQLSEATRIQSIFLEALEAENFDALPGLVFGRGFLKSLSKVINADADKLLAAYEACIEQQKNEGEEISDSTIESKKSIILNKKSKKREPIYPKLKNSFLQIISIFALSKRNIIILSAAVFAFVIILASVWALNRDSELTEIDHDKTIAAENEIFNNIDDESTPTVPTDDSQSNASSNVSLSADHHDDVIDSSAAQTLIAQDGSDEQIVEINVKTPVTVRTRVDKGKWNSVELGVDKHQFRFKDTLNLLILNAASVDVFFNGRPLGSLGKEGRVRRITFMASSEDLEKSQKT